MSKNKNRNNAKRVVGQPIVTKKPEPLKEITVETVVSSTSQAEFEKNKEALIDQLKKEIEQLNNKKTLAEETYEEQEKKNKELLENIKKLEKNYGEIKTQYDDAIEKIEMADEEASKIVNEAEQKRAETIANAAKEAKKAFREQSDDILNQVTELAERERNLHTEQLKLDRERQNFEFEKEELADQQTYVQKMKIRYSSSNPAKIEELETALRTAEDKYEMSVKIRNDISQQLNDAQVQLDAIKTEIEDSNGGKRLASVNQIVTSMQEYRNKYEKLADIYSEYPNDESIAKLKDEAALATKLEIENRALEQERNRYREEVGAARSASKELEIVRQEVDATNALNEHLLQELESHKTALESRTGDTCPSLSKVDSETENVDFTNDIRQRVQRTNLLSLSEIVSHVKNYAGSRSKDERLFYTDNDIRAFLSGMAVSRLIILQGMSGTGKSSLPRIFSEAISGFDRLIPVESSWRDRNELLGYYNDFNKKFNAKSFTIELYRSAKKKCSEIPTFIVLDEMNLARIEYYFSDFLAILQEPDHNKWLIELVSSDMRTLPMELPDEVKQRMKVDSPTIFSIWEKIERSRQGDLKTETSDEEKELLTDFLAKLGRLTGAKDLVDGRKIKVTDNIWFIGTANQDESTFEISDKVYDRAQVVSLNRKGVAEDSYKPTDRKYISVSAIQKLFDEATTNFKGKQQVEDRLREIDNILVDKFDISFGNRIVTQTIDFAAVFVAAGGTLTDALDYQISTKILRKVISSDDGEALLELLGVTNDYPETQRLINKRIKDLR